MRAFAWTLVLPLLLAGCGFFGGSRDSAKDDSEAKAAEEEREEAQTERTEGEGQPSPQDEAEKAGEGEEAEKVSKPYVPPDFPNRSAEELGMTPSGDFFQGSFHPGFDPYRSADATFSHYGFWYGGGYGVKYKKHKKHAPSKKADEKEEEDGDEGGEEEEDEEE